MLEIKIDLVPFGQEECRKQIESLFIANTGKLLTDSYAPDLYRYHAWTKDPREHDDILPSAIVYHNRSDGAWVLTMKVLKEIYGET